MRRQARGRRTRDSRQPPRTRGKTPPARRSHRAAGSGVRALVVTSNEPARSRTSRLAWSPSSRALSAVMTIEPLLPPTSKPTYGRARDTSRGRQRSAAWARRCDVIRCSGRELRSTLPASGTKYCGVVTIRSNRLGRAHGRPRCTNLARPPDRSRIHRATGSLRRPAVTTRSGQGSVNRSD